MRHLLIIGAIGLWLALSWGCSSPPVPMTPSQSLPTVQASPLVQTVTVPDFSLSSVYPQDLDLEAGVLGPADFPFMSPRYTIHTHFQDKASYGIELRYPVDEDRYHPFVKGFAVKLQLFQEPQAAWNAYIDYLSSGNGVFHMISTAADDAQLTVYRREERPGETIWVHEAAFWKGNLLGVILVKWSERLEENFFEERVNRILAKLER